jgi:hypothetical protein
VVAVAAVEVAEEEVGVAALADTRNQSSPAHLSLGTRTKPPLYLAEYVWRFNRRKYSSNEQFY